MTRRCRVSISLLALLVSVAILAACSSGPPSIHHYQLSLEAVTISPSTAPGEVVLSIDSFMTDSAYDDQRIVYRTSPYRLDYYHYHRWSAVPGTMIGDYLRKAYTEMGAFRAVVGGYTSRSDVVLTGRVSAFEELNLDQENWQARVVLELQLRDVVSGRILWASWELAVHPIEERSPEGLTQAMSKAMFQIVVDTTPKIVLAARDATTRERQGRRRGQPAEEFSAPEERLSP